MDPSSPTSPRLEQVRQLLAKAPKDPFLLYAMALELKKLGALNDALQYLQHTLEVDADYLYAYYQAGQILESQGTESKAIQMYDQGIQRARAKGDAKALSELQAARDLLG